MIGLSTLVLLALFRFATIRSFRITSMTTNIICAENDTDYIEKMDFF